MTVKQLMDELKYMEDNIQVFHHNDASLPYMKTRARLIRKPDMVVIVGQDSNE